MPAFDKRLVLGIFAASLLAACRTEAPPQSSRSASSPAPTAPTVSVQSAAPESEPAPDASRFGPVRPITAPADLERLAFLKGVCEVGVQGASAELEQYFGCTCCPPFQDCPPRADGSIVENPDRIFGIDAVARGRFTRKDAEQELVTVQGCGTTMNGGSITVFDSNGGKRVMALYEDFTIVPARCTPYRLPDGHDLAVCEALSANQSHAFLRLVAGDLTKPEAQRWREVAVFEDDSVARCFGDPGEHFVRETIVRRGFVDTNADGRLELEVELETLRAVTSQPFIDRCVAWLHSGPNHSAPAPWDLLDPPRRDRLVFLRDGSTFVASPATKRVLSKRPNHNAFQTGSGR